MSEQVSETNMTPKKRLEPILHGQKMTIYDQVDTLKAECDFYEREMVKICLANYNQEQSNKDQDTKFKMVYGSIFTLIIIATIGYILL